MNQYLAIYQVRQMLQKLISETALYARFIAAESETAMQKQIRMQPSCA